MRYVSIHLFQDFGRVLHEEYKRAQAQLEEQGTAEMGEMNLDALIELEDEIVKEERAYLQHG